jgi:hypothetical protein
MILKDLQNEISNSFSQLEYDVNPLRTDMHEAAHIGVSAVRRIFHGKSWLEVDLKSETKLIGDCLIFLTHDAFCYYFPAFLMQLTDSAVVESNLCGNFLDHLNPRNVEEKLADFYLELSEDKQKAVAHFLAYMWEQFHSISALDALEDFWDVFLSSEEKKIVYNSPEATRIQLRRLEITRANKSR